MKHFSSFISRGSKRIEVKDGEVIKSVAFSTPSHEIIIICANNRDIEKEIAFNLNGKFLTVTLDPHSINTIKSQ